MTKVKAKRPPVVETTPDAVDDAEATFQAPAEVFNKSVAINLCGVDIVIRRPSGAIRIPGVRVSASNQTGEDVEIPKHTSPGFIVSDKMDHPLWGQIDDNGAEIMAIVSRYAVNDARRGFHLVPMSKTGNLLGELRQKRRERLDLVSRLKSPEEWRVLVDNLRAKYPAHFHILYPRLPNPDTLLERFDVSWVLSPLTPINAASLNFNDLNDSDRQSVIDESNRMAHSLTMARARAIHESVFGEVVKVCDEIAAGSFETGVRRFAGISDLVTSLERLKNFSEFGSPEIVAHADNTLELLRGITDVQSLNANKGKNSVTAALKAVVAPLKVEIAAMYQETKVRSGRSLE